MMETIYIVAGGTGGHINAAIAMGEEFNNEYKVKYLTGTRYLDYQLFKDLDVLHLESRPLRTRNILILLKSLFFNLKVFTKIIRLYKKEKPCFVLGAGGYICGPTLLAAKIIGIPIFIIEQNAVAGMTNRILSKIAGIIFTNFKNTKKISGNQNRVVVVGNPIRKSIKESRVEAGEHLNLLVFGGSLGASQINKAITEYIKNTPFRKISILHQVGKDHNSVPIDVHSDIEYRQKEYLDNMNESYAWSDIIICRSGASTVSELRVVQRPAIIIPFPNATDNHQYFNALELKKEDGFFVDIIDQKLTGADLSNQIGKSIENIEKNQLYYKNKIELKKTTELIKNEILKYVRNK